MIYKEAEIKKLFNLVPMGTKGWYKGEKCPYCGAIGKFGIIFSRNKASFNCFAGKCQKKGSLFFLLKDIGRLDLVGKIISIDKPLEKLGERKNKFKIISPPPKKMPFGFKVYEELTSYLKERKVTQTQVKLYEIGESINPLYKNYVLFPIRIESAIRGFMGRYIGFSKEELGKINERRKEKGFPHILRFKNSVGTDFDSLLYGIDEVIDETNTVILVESILGKYNIDNLLDLYSSSQMKCCSTLGSSISPTQINYLVRKGVQNLILLYDPDAIKQIKKYSFELDIYFDVWIGVLEEKDPNELNGGELNSVLENVISPIAYFTRKI